MRMGGKLRDAIVELYRKVSTELPSDVVEGLRKAIGNEEKDSAAFNVIGINI